MRWLFSPGPNPAATAALTGLFVFCIMMLLHLEHVRTSIWVAGLSGLAGALLAQGVIAIWRRLNGSADSPTPPQT